MLYNIIGYFSYGIHSDINAHELLSQKVIGCFLYDFLFSPPRVGIEPQIVFVHVFVEFQEGGLVVASVAVVGRAEDGADAVAVLQLVALVHQLMGTRDHLQVVAVVELLCHVLRRTSLTAPNRNPAPRGLSLNPTAASSGSLQSRSEPAPF